MAKEDSIKCELRSSVLILIEDPDSVLADNITLLFIGESVVRLLLVFAITEVGCVVRDDAVLEPA